MKAPKTRILVLGGGFAGLEFCKNFEHADAEITLIDRQNHHLFQPLLYQVATTGLPDSDIAQPIRSIFRKRKDITVLKGEVKGIDLSGKTVAVGQQYLPYDYLVIGMGAKTSYFGNDQWAKYAPGMKSLDDAHFMRNKILNALELAERTDDPDKRRRLMTIAIVGAGPTGVELAGALTELIHTVMREDFRRINPKDVKIILIEAAPRVLPPFTEANARRAHQHLRELGIEVRLNHMVKNIREGVVVFEDSSIEAGNIFWTAGVGPGVWTRKLGVETDRAGRIVVEPHLNLPGYPEVFAVGDVAACTDIKGQRVPGVSPAAMQMGRYVARLIRDELRGRPRDTRKGFAYWDKGAMAIIGRYRAVLQTKRLQFGGFFAWLGWLFVHVLFLYGFKSKLSVLQDWLYSYVFHRRRARLILDQDRTFQHYLENPQVDNVGTVDGATVQNQQDHELELAAGTRGEGI
ncbi:MAG: NAD(P)/FAD-dependent oxidoreductase [Opitutales bacterium]